MSSPVVDPAPDDGSIAVVVVAHGSRTAAANEAHLATAAALAETVPHPVVAAFLELAQPDIGTGIDRAVATGAATVLVLPYFLYPGRHVAEDVPALVAAAAKRHAGATIRLLEPFGSDPAALAALADQIRAAADPTPGP